MRNLKDWELGAMLMFVASTLKSEQETLELLSTIKENKAFFVGKGELTAYAKDAKMSPSKKSPLWEQGARRIFSATKPEKLAAVITSLREGDCIELTMPMLRKIHNMEGINLK